MRIRCSISRRRSLAGVCEFLDVWHVFDGDVPVNPALVEQVDTLVRARGRAELGETSQLSRHVARMAERGLAKKEKCGGPAGRLGAAPGHVAAVRRLFVDVVPPEQLDGIADVAEAVLARLDGGTAAA